MPAAKIAPRRWAQDQKPPAQGEGVKAGNLVRLMNTVEVTEASGHDDHRATWWELWDSGVLQSFQRARRWFGA